MKNLGFCCKWSLSAATTMLTHAVLSTPLDYKHEITLLHLSLPVTLFVCVHPSSRVHVFVCVQRMQSPIRERHVAHTTALSKSLFSKQFSDTANILLNEIILFCGDIMETTGHRILKTLQAAYLSLGDETMFDVSCNFFLLMLFELAQMFEQSSWLMSDTCQCLCQTPD